MYYQWDHSVLILQCRIQPRAGTDAFAGVVGDALKIRIRAVPADGEANRQLRRFLAGQFRVAQEQVQILSGSSSRNKRVAIDRPGEIPASLAIKEA